MCALLPIGMEQADPASLPRPVAARFIEFGVLSIAVADECAAIGRECKVPIPAKARREGQLDVVVASGRHPPNKTAASARYTAGHIGAVVDHRTAVVRPDLVAHPVLLATRCAVGVQCFGA